MLGDDKDLDRKKRPMYPRYQRIINWVSDAQENEIYSDLIRKSFIQNGLPQAQNEYLINLKDLHSKLKNFLNSKGPVDASNVEGDDEEDDGDKEEEDEEEEEKEEEDEEEEEVIG